MWITLNRSERPWVAETAVQATMCFSSTSNTIKPDDSIPAMICAREHQCNPTDDKQNWQHSHQINFSATYIVPAHKCTSLAFAI